MFCQWLERRSRRPNERDSYSQRWSEWSPVVQRGGTTSRGPTGTRIPVSLPVLHQAKLVPVPCRHRLPAIPDTPRRVPGLLVLHLRRPHLGPRHLGPPHLGPPHLGPPHLRQPHLRQPHLVRLRPLTRLPRTAAKAGTNARARGTARPICTTVPARTHARASVAAPPPLAETGSAGRRQRPSSAELKRSP